MIGHCIKGVGEKKFLLNFGVSLHVFYLGHITTSMVGSRECVLAIEYIQIAATRIFRIACKSARSMMYILHWTHIKY